MVCRDRGMRRTEIVKIVDYVSEVACTMEYPVTCCSEFVKYVRSRLQAKWEYFIVIILTVPNRYLGIASWIGTPGKGEMHYKCPPWSV